MISIQALRKQELAEQEALRRAELARQNQMQCGDFGDECSDLPTSQPAKQGVLKFARFLYNS